jgi:choline dehydrogenase-like flavoprotein
MRKLIFSLIACLFLTADYCQAQIYVFEYIVVGAGTTGSPLAAELGARYNTALLEYGPKDSQLTNPETVRNLDNNKWLGYNGEADVQYFTTPQLLTYYNGTKTYRSFESRRYKGTHGCNGHNAGWGRYGVKEMYDRWPSGWKSRDMRRYLDKAFREMNSGVPSKHAALQAKIMNEWKRATGYPIIDDSKLIQFSQLGIQKSIFNYQLKNNGTYYERYSSFDAFVKPELEEEDTNLQLFTYRRMDNIIWQFFDEKGKRLSKPIARALEVTNRLTNTKEIFYSSKEIIFAGGAFDTVGMMQRSGIGNCTELELMNITCVFNNPNVGEGMLYHMVLAPLMSVSNDAKLIEPNTQFTTQAGVAISTEKKNYIDATIDFHMETNDIYLPSPPLPKPLAYAILLSMKDFGPGKVTIDPQDHHKLLIDLRLLQNQWEVPHMISIFNEYRKLLNASSVYDEEFAPGPSVQTFQQKYDYVLNMIQFGEHPIATNQMLKVVDTKLKVYGVEGLRIADLSVIPNGNHVNPNMMAAAIGLKAADLVLRDAHKHR